MPGHVDDVLGSSSSKVAHWGILSVFMICVGSE